MLSWLCLAGEDELQDWHGEGYHAYADGRPCGNDGGCGAFMPVVGFQNDDISCWRQNSQKEKHLRMREQLVKVHARSVVHPAGERQHADAVDAHEPGAQERPSGGAGQVGAVQFGGAEPHAQNNQSDKAENPR